MSDLRHHVAVTELVIRAGIAVHSALGPGLLENAYRACLACELRDMQLEVEIEKPLPLRYKAVKLDLGYRLDLVVAHSVIVEVKAVRQLVPVHEAQLLSYLRLTGLHSGLLMNFHVPRLRDGLKRMVNG